MVFDTTAPLRPWARRVSLVLLGLAAVPDVLPYAGLKRLIGERFGLDDAEAQLFALAALFGALCAVPLLARIRRMSPRRIFAGAALVQAIVISCMALPVDWSVLLVLRGLQGAVDLFLLVVLTTLVAASSPTTGRGFGATGASILFGLAFGLVAGGILAAQVPGLVFPAAAVVSLVLAVAAWILPDQVALSVRAKAQPRDRQIMTGAAFSASDRMINGVLTISLPFVLVASFGAAPSTVGLILAVPLIACAIGGYFAGMLVDRIGALPARMIGVPLQVIGVLCIVYSFGTVSLMVAGTLCLALGATALMPTSLVIGVGQRPQDVSVDAVGGIQAIGQAGHLFGVLLAFVITVYVGAVTPAGVAGVVGFYVVWNVFWFMQARRLQLTNPQRSSSRAGQRPILGPSYGRQRPSRPSAALIEPLGEVYPDSAEHELEEESVSCPSTNTNVSKTVKS